MKSEQKEEQTLDAQDEEQIDDSNQLDGKGTAKWQCRF